MRNLSPPPSPCLVSLHLRLRAFLLTNVSLAFQSQVILVLVHVEPGTGIPVWGNGHANAFAPLPDGRALGTPPIGNDKLFVAAQVCNGTQVVANGLEA